ncbi:MAG: hypothetical protein ACYSWU_04640 [Planctomycetota bacterium]|jgi:carbonic anhydrase/acetyltransferase-like protein (isoleucine patch superfamily)
MTNGQKTLVGGAVLLAALVCLGGFFLSPPGTMAQNRSGINVHPTADVHPTAHLQGKVTVGPFTRIDAGTIITGNVTIRGTNRIGNYTHIYDNVNIEGGRPAKVASSTAQVPDRSIIGDGCWINHGATMHGTQIADGGAVGLNACCDYNTRIGKGAILANGSATHVDQVIPEDSFAEGVPAVVKKQNITDDDRRDYFGLLPAGWTRFEASKIEADIRRNKGL